MVFSRTENTYNRPQDKILLLKVFFYFSFFNFNWFNRRKTRRSSRLPSFFPGFWEHTLSLSCWRPLMGPTTEPTPQALFPLVKHSLLLHVQLQLYMVTIYTYIYTKFTSSAHQSNIIIWKHLYFIIYTQRNINWERAKYCGPREVLCAEFSVYLKMSKRLNKRVGGTMKGTMKSLAFVQMRLLF